MLLLIAIVAALFILFLAFNGKCRTPTREGLRGGGGGGGGGGRGGGGGGRGGSVGRSGSATRIGGGASISAGTAAAARVAGSGGRSGSWSGGRSGRHRSGSWGGHRHRGRRGWGGGWGGWYGYPGWADWWYDPVYYYALPSGYEIDEDPCNCFDKYRTAIDTGVPKAVAAASLVKCVQATLSGTCI